MIFYIPLFLSFAATKIVYYKPVCKIEMKNPNPKPWEEYIQWENRYERSPVIGSVSKDAVKKQKVTKKIPSGRVSYKNYIKKIKKYDRAQEEDN